MRMRTASTPPAMPAYRATFMEAARDRAAEPSAPAMSLTRARAPGPSTAGRGPHTASATGGPSQPREPPCSSQPGEQSRLLLGAFWPGLVGWDQAGLGTLQEGDTDEVRGRSLCIPVLPGLPRLQESPQLSARLVPTSAYPGAGQCPSSKDGIQTVAAGSRDSRLPTECS